MKATSLSREEVYGALGWLGREDKIVLDQKGRAMVFSLRDEEVSLSVHRETAIAEPRANDRNQSLERASSQRRPRRLARVKAPVKQAESPAIQSERVEEFLASLDLVNIISKFRTKYLVGNKYEISIFK